MNNTENMKLNINDLDGISGGNYAQTADIMNAIDANPALSKMFRNELNSIYGEDEEVDVIAATRVLDKLGIKASIDYRTAKSNTYNGGSMSHADVLKKLKGYK